MVRLNLENANEENVTKLFALCNRPSDQLNASLVEFPGILLPAFKPTLLALQEMKKSGDLALSQYILPSPIEDQEELLVPPPVYSQKPGSKFNLRCLLKKEEDLFFTPSHPFDTRLLAEGSELDEAQAVALIDALSRCVGLIQGPPGTGKSFVGVALIRVLLANKEAMAAAAQPDLTGISPLSNSYPKTIFFHA